MRLVFCGFVCGLSSLALAQVAVNDPLSHSLTQALLHGSDIEVHYLPPERLPLNRIPSWLNSQRTQAQPEFELWVSWPSIRPELDFYTSLRQSNIRLVPIDLATALVPAGEQVAIQRPEDSFWLNINNLLLMLGILSRDLQRFYPEQQRLIQSNHQLNSSELRQLSLAMDSLLLEHEIQGLINDSSRTQAFGQSLMLPVYPQAPVDLSDEVRLLTISHQARDDVWLIDDFFHFSELSLIERWQQNLVRLEQLLSQP